MTQKIFREALLRGQGRCIIAARKEPERYKKVILWACSHEVAFDPQCEGTKADYVYELITCFHDRSPFLEAAVSAFEKCRSDRGWLTPYLAELLTFFARDGSKMAEDALWKKYEMLYAALLNKKKAPCGVFPQRDDFAMLAQVLALSRSAMGKIAADIGRLYLERDFYTAYDFDWLFETKAERYMKSLQRKAERCPHTREFLRQGLAPKKGFKPVPPKALSELSGVVLSVRLRKADADAVRSYADNYLSETEPEVRAKALKAFCRCAFPYEPDAIIADAGSDFPALRDAAFEALENIRSSAVRAFALKELERGNNNAIRIFINNYLPEDEQLLTELVAALPVDFQENGTWHGVYSTVLDMKSQGLTAPIPVLLHIYENCYCSLCRCEAIRQLDKRRALGREISEECLFDCCYEARKLAQKRLRK